jgi:hypothetical protein
MTRPYFCAAFTKALAGHIVAEVVVKTDDGALVRRVAKTRAAAVAALPAHVDRARLPSDWS